MASIPSLILLLGFLLRASIALEVTPGSSCASFCIDSGESNAFDSSSSTTNTSDIVCKDGDFSGDNTGIKFQSCLECLQKSKKKNGTESDLHWYLYNLRYTITTCLYSAPVAPSFDIDSPCVIDYACEPLKDALTFDNLTDKAGNTYGYCDADDKEFMGSKLKSCISCLQSSSNQVYLSNFMTALEAGCEQKPAAGELLSLSGTVFSNSSVNITTPAEDITDKPAGAGSSTMTVGTIVGIAVGTALFFFGAVALFCIYWRRQKQAKKDAQNRSNFGTPDPFLPPHAKMSSSLRSYSAQSQYENGPTMANGDYYDLLEKEARNTTRLTYNFDPRGQGRGPDSAIPTHQAYNPAAISRAIQPVHQSSHRTSHNPITPQPTHQRNPSTLSDAFSLQTYINNANGNSNEVHSAVTTHSHNQFLPPPPPPYNNAQSSRPTSMTTVPPPPAGPPPNQRRRVPSLRVPSLAAPSVPRLRMPKKYTPPTVITTGATPVDEQPHVLDISGPVMTSDPRFKDVPLAGSVVYADRAPQRGPNEYEELPIRSGKSTLYGM